MSKYPTARLRFVAEKGEVVLYCEVKMGKRFVPIAKRYSQQNWIGLEPGYTVRGSEPGTSSNTISITYSATNAAAQ
jgi:hypothetical protein